MSSLPGRAGALALAAVFIGGCSTPSHSPSKLDDAQVRQFSSSGYQSAEQHGAVTTYASWQAGDSLHEVALSVPSAPGRYPLVIYLPALGEGRTAAEAWRAACARAGYAVLSLQPLAEDAQAWSSDRARAGAFELLARERYSDKAMSERLQALAGALRELARRHAAGEPALERADVSRVALAGFDLGAFTAMTVAGESLRGVVVPPLSVSIRAVIALSPYAGFSGPSFAGRYRTIRLPVLSITGDADADALGVVSGAYLRTAPFEYMPAGDKYLALLAGMPHRIFGGAMPAPGEDPDARAAEPGGSGPRGSGPQGGRGGGGHGHFAGGASAPAAGPHGGHGGASPEGADASRGILREGVPQRASPTQLAIGAVAVQVLSIAFLDAVVKDDAIAREWLQKDAGRWLRGRGELKYK